VAAFAEAARIVAPTSMHHQQALAPLIVHIVVELDSTCRTAALDVPEDLREFVEANRRG